MKAIVAMVSAIWVLGCSSPSELLPVDGGAVDAGDAGPSDFLAECLVELPSRMDTRVHRFASADGRFELLVVSAAPADYCPGGQLCACNGGSCYSYDLLRLGVVDNGVGVCLRAAAELEYVGGQHSWGEVASGSDDTTRYVVRMMFSFATNSYTDTLELRDAHTDALLEGPIALVSEDCYAIPAGTNQGCCERCQSRERSDD